MAARQSTVLRREEAACDSRGRSNGPSGAPLLHCVPGPNVVWSLDEIPQMTDDERALIADYFGALIDRVLREP